MEDVLNTVLDVLFLPLYVFVVFTVHESGHYFAARFFKIGIDSFSLGYGRELWRKTDRSGTAWIVRLYPVCGQVHIQGAAFNKAPYWQRFITVCAGPAINLVFAFLLLFAFFVAFGQPSKYPVITGIEPGAPADQAGLQLDDRFIEIEGQKIQRYRDVWNFTSVNAGKPLSAKVERGDTTVSLSMTPALLHYTDPQGLEREHGRLGMMMGRTFLDLEALEGVNGTDVKDKPDEARKLLLQNLGKTVQLSIKSTDGKAHKYRTYIDAKLNDHLRDPQDKDYDTFYAGKVRDHFYLSRGLGGSLNQALKETGMMIGNILKVPFQLFPIDKEDIRPWAVVSAEGQYPLRKLYEFTYRTALVSIFIALLNLIPFPGLDGSVLLRLVLEKLLGGDSAAAKKAYKYAVLIVLIGLYGTVVAVNVPDIPHYLTHKAKKLGEHKSSHHWLPVHDRTETR